MQIALLRSVLFVALAGGCAGTGQFTVTSEAAPPELVVISPGVQVIADRDEPIFYSGNYYWRNQGGFWYRSTSHTRGWARVEVAPVEIRTIERPSAYIHYRGTARAQVSPERRTSAPPVVVRDHREVPPASRRDDRHDRDGHDRDGHDRDGHDKDRHDKDGHDRDGHDKDRHDKDGHDKDGHDRDGHDGHDRDDKHHD